MSDGSGFDMTLLEGKDRAQLAAIAEQLGQKPGARAKKADIVALILRLVGADEAEETEAEPVAAEPAEEGAVGDQPTTNGAEATPSAEPGTDADGSSSRRGGGRDGGSQQARNRGQDEPGGNQGQAKQGQASQGEGQGQKQGNQNQGQGQNQGNQNQGQGRGQQGASDDAGNEPNGNQREPGTDQQEGEAESGNRRRRRRGRDRDRRPEGDDQAPVEPIVVEGMVDLREEGYGFLRLHGYLPSRDDAYISVKQTRQFGLRTGDIVGGKSRPPARNEKNPALLQVDSVNGYEAHNQPPRPRFDELTARFPDERLTLEQPDDPSNLTVRAIDLLAPVGKGTRGLIVAPPKAGATTVVKQLVRAIEVNHPDIELFVLLIDERPEEVTEMQRWLLRGSVASSAFDRPPEEHASVAELVIERAKRLVEAGKDVVVVVDGLTPLARACNLAAPAGGRIVAGGLDTRALLAPKALFGAARKAEEGGSLTILATVAAGTASPTDEAVFEEFAGSETQELRLDRRLADRRLHPAIDVTASSTRHDELLFDRAEADQVTALRQLLTERVEEAVSNAAGLELLLERLAATKTNAELLAAVAKG